MMNDNHLLPEIAARSLSNFREVQCRFYQLCVKTFIPIVALCTLCTIAIAQDHAPNTYHRSDRSDLTTIHCDALFDLAYNAVDSNAKSSVKYGLASLMIASKIGDTTRMLKAVRISSLSMRMIGSSDSALKLMIRYLPVAKRNKDIKQVKYFLNGIGLTYLDRSLYDLALVYFFESLNTRQTYGDLQEISIAYNNLGLVYFKLEDYEQAIIYYKKAIDEGKKIDYKYLLGNAWFNISLCYAYKKVDNLARKSLQKGYTECGIDCPIQAIMNAKFSEGLICFSGGEYSDSEKCFLKSYSIAKNLNDERLQIDNINYLCKTYLKANKLVEMRPFTSISQKLIDSNVSYSEGATELCAGLIEYYQRVGDLTTSNMYKDKYIAIKDSLFSHKLTKNLMRIEARNNEEKNRTKLENQRKVLALTQQLIERREALNIVLGIVIALFVAIVAVLYRNNRLKKFTNNLLEERVKERTRQLEANQTVLHQTLNERDIQMKKISNDVRTTLATIKGLCVLVENDPDEPMTTEYIRRINTTSNQLLIIISRFVGN